MSKSTVKGKGLNDIHPNYNSFKNSGRSSQADYVRLTQLISSNIRNIKQNVQAIKKMVSQLGTARDTPALRDQLHQRQHHTDQNFQDTAKYIKDIAFLPSAASWQRLNRNLTNRLLDEFCDVVNAFQAAQREAVATEKECVARVKVASAAQHEYRGDLLINTQGSMQDQQQAAITQDELNEIEERENAIRQLERDITDVNQIFKDLRSMVEEQGQLLEVMGVIMMCKDLATYSQEEGRIMIDSVEPNVERAEENVIYGNVQLVKPRRSQADERKKKLVWAAAILVTIVLLIIILYYATKGNN